MRVRVSVRCRVQLKVKVRGRVRLRVSARARVRASARVGPTNLRRVDAGVCRHVEGDGERVALRDAWGGVVRIGRDK